ncbi:xylan 1,4-beta-xylosidase [Enterococcus sp. AZ194]|uniref:glycoside hydrolase family 43 protein n=1 Tax=Enterococcus sp. AZ194 TaxID=2774629 RepID=UPI003F1F4A5C
MITNPILPGFHPDASIVQVGDEYYLATSTFEWLPGVEIYHSKDLVNWTVVAQPLVDKVNVNLRGNYNSGSIWAPHLSYSEGRFWLIYTDVKSRTQFKDTLNYVISASEITGPWSEPVFVTASGFDPALFHDDDGRHYFINMLYDHRVGRQKFAGLVMQEFDCNETKLIGQRQHFFTGTDLGVCEGPQLMKKDGYYYLLCAAGGTGYSHAATVCRSKNVWGPYEVSEFHPLMTTKDDPTNPIQKAGHASFVQAGDEWFIVHIMARPLTLQRGRCPLGRETGIQKIEWVNEWPRLASRRYHPDRIIDNPRIFAEVQQQADFSERIDFSCGELPKSFKTLRHSLDEKISFDENPGYLRIYGAQSLSSLHEQSLLARRWQSTTFRAETAMRFVPNSFQEMAGLILFYDTENWQYLFLSYDEEKQAHYVQLEVCDNNECTYYSDEVYLENSQQEIQLRVEVDHQHAQFYYGHEDEWHFIGRETQADHLSDDYIREKGGMPFTGAFVGICVQDLDQHTNYADFKYFYYDEKH